jgi:hypothetical protein
VSSRYPLLPSFPGALLFEELLFEGGHADVGCVQLSAEKLSGVQRCLGLKCQGLQSSDLLAEAVDLQRPAGLMCVVAVVCELHGLAQGIHFALQVLNIRGIGCARGGLGASDGEQTIDAGDSAAGAEALLEGGSQLRSRGKLISFGQLMNQKLDVVIADMRGIHHGIVLSERASGKVSA